MAWEEAIPPDGCQGRACVRACVCVVMVIPKVDVEAVCALAVAVWQRATGRERPAEEEG